MGGPTATGIGEIFGQSVDAVLRRPLPAVVPLLVDAGSLLVALLVLALLGSVPGPAYARASFGFGISTGLPSLADTLDLAAAAQTLAAGNVVPFLILAALFVPVAAFAEAGFVAVLHRAYVERVPGPLFGAFLPAVGRSFLPLLAYRATLAAGFALALFLAAQGGVLRNGVVGALALRFLLLFVPYAAVVDRTGFLEATRRSLGAVADHLATCLVALLFLLLTAGGVAALVSPFVRAFGSGAVLVGILVYAPVGTVLATFVLKLWLSLQPPEPLAEPATAPAPRAEPA